MPSAEEFTSEERDIITEYAGRIFFRTAPMSDSCRTRIRLKVVEKLYPTHARVIAGHGDDDALIDSAVETAIRDYIGFKSLEGKAAILVPYGSL